MRNFNMSLLRDVLNVYGFASFPQNSPMMSSAQAGASPLLAGQSRYPELVMRVELL